MSKYARNIKIVAEKPKEESTFGSFEKKGLAVVTEAEDVENFAESMLAFGIDCWLPFLFIGSDDDWKLKCKDAIYDKEFVANAAEATNMKWYSLFEGRYVRFLCKVAGSIQSNVCFSNEGHKAWACMMGYSRVVDGYWCNPVLANDRPKMVVKIDSTQAVDLQLFCASVEPGVKRVRKTIDGTPQQVNVPMFIGKNNVTDQQIPLEIKKLLLTSGILVLPEKEDLTISDISRAPLITRSIYESVKNIRIGFIGGNSTLHFFSTVKMSFPYLPGPLDISDILYTNYPNMLKEFSHHIAKHSLFVAGIFANKFHFLNEGVRYLSEPRLIGGNVPVKWCAYNTHKNVTWERKGAFIESDYLGTKVQPPRVLADFDGVCYDPTNLVASGMGKAKGLIIPYDAGDKGLNCCRRWALPWSKAGRKFRIWATYGPAACLWIVIADREGGDTMPYVDLSVELLWKSLPVMNFYNFCASLNRNYCLAEAKGDRAAAEAEAAEMLSAGVPTNVVASIHAIPATVNRTVKGKIVKAPGFEVRYFPSNYLPGRHVVDAARPDGGVRDELTKFDEFNDFAQARAGDFPVVPKGEKPTSTPGDVTPVVLSDAEDDLPKPKRRATSMRGGMDLE